MANAGQPPTIPGLNGSLTSLAIRLRDLCAEIQDLNLQVGKLGVAGLVALGTDNATATDMVAQYSRINTIAAIYFNKATQASLFDFNDALAPQRAGQ
jgi:hypothetical protein